MAFIKLPGQTDCGSTLPIFTHTHHTDSTFWLRSLSEKAVYMTLFIKCNLCGFYFNILNNWSYAVQHLKTCFLVVD